MEGVNSTMIYFKDFCKFHNVPQYNNMIYTYMYMYMYVCVYMYINQLIFSF
jgi:hypothetical protein